MDPWIAILSSVIVATIASSGFWAYLLKLREKNSATSRLLMGLAHDKLLHLGMSHLQNGFITKEDYDDLQHYLYVPYIEMGGNGTVERVMREVARLPLKVHKAPLYIETEEKHDRRDKYDPNAE